MMSPQVLALVHLAARATVPSVSRRDAWRLTAHTEPNASTGRRVVAAGMPLPAMRYTTADNHSGPWPPCA